MFSRPVVLATLLGSVLLGSVLSSPATAESMPPLLRQFDGPALERRDFNRLAMQRNSPLFWREDKDHKGLIDPSELAVVGVAPRRTRYVRGDEFTRRFVREYRTLVQARRREAVRRELDAGRPTLVQSDLRQLSPAEKRMAKHLVAAADLIDRLYYRQTGAAAHLKAISRASSTNQALFSRNSGPWCTTIQTRGDPFCNALPSFPVRRSESYPLDLAHDAAMCQLLEKHKDAGQLLAPFTAVRRRGKELVAIPLHRAFPSQMRAISKRLRAAARALEAVPQERALREYLFAVAKAFLSGDWEAADTAWAVMSSDNSKWYLRVGPDEVYQDVCQRKAGFHLALARIDTHSLKWKGQLTPLRTVMELAVAKLVGGDYRPRTVRFEMPDFIRVVLNAGDSRHPLGATIGQSLPNWGKLAREGRGRTVVMTNLYTDPDSRSVARKQAESLLDKATLQHYTDSSAPSLLVTILHEASHNFGPHSDFRVGGKPPGEIFGGRLASTLEELKAQSMGLWFLQLLQQRGLLSATEVQQAYTKALMWAFGHLSRGMRTSGGNARPYSQLAAIQLGHMMETGALRHHEGKFSLRYEALPAIIGQLAQRVGQIKVRGDVEAARKLIERYTSAPALRKLHAGDIRRRMLRYPKASFRYVVLI